VLPDKVLYIQALWMLCNDILDFGISIASLYYNRFLYEFYLVV